MAQVHDAGAGDLHVEVWGTGAPVVLVHGSLATGAEEWEAQRPLAEEGFRLSVFDRRGYGQSPLASGEDFLVDADDIVELLGDGAHLVGHSYGGLGVDARRCPSPRRHEVADAARAAAPRCPPIPTPPGRRWSDEVRVLWDQDIPDEEWVVRFLKAVGSDPDQFPPEMLAAAVPLVPVFRRRAAVLRRRAAARRTGCRPVPEARRVRRAPRRLRRACAPSFARRIGAALAVVEGAGHEIQFTGRCRSTRNCCTLWRSVNADSGAGR